MVARIYQPAKNAMQSGRAKADQWIMEFDAEAAKSVDPLMGWTGASDMRNNEVRMRFDSSAAAVAFAEQQGLAYQLIATPPQRRKIKSYSENFSNDRSMPWTH